MAAPREEKPTYLAQLHRSAVIRPGAGGKRLAR